jgi:hypothetical protein
MAADDDDGEREGAGDVPLSDELIDADMPCLRCGYNLRGLKPVGQCPECGSRIEKTVDYVMARILCPVCMGPNHPTAAVCVHCKSPISGAAATAMYWKPMAISGGRRKGREEEDEPEAPSAAWAFMCTMFGLFLLVPMLANLWVPLWTQTPQYFESRGSVLVGQLLGSLFLLIPTGLVALMIVLPVRQHLRRRKKYQEQHAVWLSKQPPEAQAGGTEEDAMEPAEGDKAQER